MWRDDLKKRLDDLDAGTAPLEDWDSAPFVDDVASSISRDRDRA